MEANSKTFAPIVVSDSETILIPQGMELETAARLIQEQWQKTEMMTRFTEAFDVIPFEGAVALQEALYALFPDVWKGADESVSISLEVEPGKTITVPWGAFSVPGIDGAFETDLSYSDAGTLEFRLNARIKQKNEPDFRNIVAKVRSILSERMIYKGKAFQIQFRDSDGDLIAFLSPKALDTTSAVMPYFNETTKERIEVEVLDVLRKKDLMREFGVPLKKGFLLAATYGMGKTLLGRFVARVAIENGWTFIYVTSASELPEAYALARSYMPAVVFVEDINRVVGASRNAQVDRVLNILDGVDSKNDEIIVAMTTNDPDEIHPALLRPGRVDSIIRIEPFDQKTVELLLRQYAGDSLAKDCKLTKVCKRLEGQTGARIAHVVKQSKIYALHHLVEGTLQITEDDLLKAAEVSILEAKRIDEDFKDRSASIVPVILSLLSSNPEMLSSYMPHPNGNGEKIH